MLPTPPPRREDGKLEIAVTDLEMRDRPLRNNRVSLTGHTLEVHRALRPTLHFYRYLYATVGAPYLWSTRLKLSDAELEELVQDPRFELQVLYVDRGPVGLAEIDRTRQGTALDEVDLLHFGLVPEYLGRGLGLRFLDRLVDIAWQDDPSRLTVHATSLDHPRALLVYQRAGFVPYDRRTIVVDDPRPA